jgi:ABC-type uncharacterized transport system ATPase subunit
MRHGKVTGQAVPREETPASLARMMIGRELPVCQAPAFTGEHRTVLTVRACSLVSDDTFGTDLVDVSLTVNAGEILGIAGISGNGQAELMAALSGEDTVERHAIPPRRCADRPSQRRAAALQGARLRAGRAPRARRGAAFSLSHNALLTAHRKGMKYWGLVRYSKAREFAEKCVAASTCVAAAMPTRALAVRRQPAEVHRRARDHAQAER